MSIGEMSRGLIGIVDLLVILVQNHNTGSQLCAFEELSQLLEIILHEEIGVFPEFLASIHEELTLVKGVNVFERMNDFVNPV